MCYTFKVENFEAYISLAMYLCSIHYFDEMHVLKKG